jgi:hypothetical protein
VDHRAIVLDRLEVAEARYIRNRDTPEPPIKLDTFDPESKSSRTTGAEVPSLGRSRGLLMRYADCRLHESTWWRS